MTAALTPLSTKAVMDACVMSDFGVGDLILRIAERTDLCELFWSEQILEETRRTQLGNLQWEPRVVENFHRELRKNMPHSLIGGHEKWIEHCTNDEGDRHVLACAIEVGAPAIITYNKRHFGPEHLARWNIRQVHPQDYLLWLHSRDEEAIWKQLAATSNRKRISVEAVLKALDRPNGVPKFARALLAEIGG